MSYMTYIFKEKYMKSSIAFLGTKLKKRKISMFTEALYKMPRLGLE